MGHDGRKWRDVDLMPAHLPLAPRAGLDNILARAAPPSLTYWLHQLLVDSLLGLAQAATENGQQVKPDIGVAAEYTAQYTAEFP